MTTNPNKENSFTFDGLQMELNQAGYNTFILPVNADNAVEQLLVSTRENTESETQTDSPVVQLMFVNDLLTASKIPAPGNETDILQFFVSLPLQVDKSKMPDMYKLLSMFSRLVPLGAFGIEEDGGAFYRYSLMSLNRNLENKLVVETVKMISFFMNKFSVQLNDFVQGKKSLPDILNETEKEMSQVGK
jgi:hypothetical protein